MLCISTEQNCNALMTFIVAAATISKHSKKVQHQQLPNDYADYMTASLG